MFAYNTDKGKSGREALQRPSLILDPPKSGEKQHSPPKAVFPTTDTPCFKFMLFS
jgi:hypothetical protein